MFYTDKSKSVELALWEKKEDARFEETKHYAVEAIQADYRGSYEEEQTPESIFKKLN